MNDGDSWVDLEDASPPWMDKLLDAARPDLPAAQAAQMERSFLDALATQRRSRTRKRRAKVTLSVGLLAVGAAAAAAAIVAARSASLRDLPPAPAMASPPPAEPELAPAPPARQVHKRRAR